MGWPEPALAQAIQLAQVQADLAQAQAKGAAEREKAREVLPVVALELDLVQGADQEQDRFQELRFKAGRTRVTTIRRRSQSSPRHRIT